jgi:hypothetical protein
MAARGRGREPQETAMIQTLVDMVVANEKGLALSP